MPYASSSTISDVGCLFSFGSRLPKTSEEFTHESQSRIDRSTRMKRTSILASFLIFQSICCWLSPATAVAQPLTSRSVTASSYIERAVAWFAKGEYERALADIDLAVSAD